MNQFLISQQDFKTSRLALYFELRNFKYPLKYHILPSAVNI